MGTRNMILQPTEFAILNGVVYIGEDEAESYSKGREPQLRGEVFDDTELSFKGAYTSNIEMLLLLYQRLGWGNFNGISHEEVNGVNIIKYNPEVGYVAGKTAGLVNLVN